MIERFGDAVNLRRAKNGGNGYISWEAAVAWIVWRERSSHHEATPTSDGN
ncbi:DNA-binding protein [Citrobacter freundii]|nr:DNA-binding protein [Citrobacter freundii]EGT3579955.1 DNA-binding protein [Citrobacter freundii]